MVREVVLNKQTFVGFALDTKPSGIIALNSEYIEFDEDNKTITKYKFNGIDWIQFEVNTYSGASTIVVGGNEDLLQGNITCNGAKQAISATSLPCKVITLQANPANTANILVGNSLLDDTHYAFILVPGGNITLSISNANKIFIKGTTSDKISFGGEA
ncbi:MAG: hypothetical protein K0Q47_14 [Sedimentibacter sp.]|jgi:hypothetical protein|nr:hypothetical protein [Sedimentibacter sp.]